MIIQSADLSRIATEMMVEMGRGSADDAFGLWLGRNNISEAAVADLVQNCLSAMVEDVFETINNQKPLNAKTHLDSTIVMAFAIGFAAGKELGRATNEDLA